MLKFIDRILNDFQLCFKRKEAFIWFSIVVIGLMIRSDYRGVTSIVGALSLDPGMYESMIHFFRSQAINLELIKYQWCNSVLKSITPVKIQNKLIVIGDHIKVSKEARKMPAVKKIYQDSENFSKARYIFGHQHGAIGVLAEGETLQCVITDIELHEGLTTIDKFKGELEGKDEKNDSVKINCVERMMIMIGKFVTNYKSDIIALLDSYFANATAFKYTDKFNEENSGNKILLVSRAKSNVVGYKSPEASELKKKGRKRKYGEKIKLKEIFSTSFKDTEKIKVQLYDKIEEVEYLCLDLLWKPVKRLCRFVLVKTKDKTMILIASDTSISPVEMIIAYSYRFKIEVSFKSLKHTIKGFFYHFWTTAMPKLSRFKKEADLTGIEEENEKKKIVLTVKAIETFTLLSCIAMGMLTIMSLKFNSNIWKLFKGWLRTKSSKVPSVETTKAVLFEEWLMNFRSLEKYPVLSQIRKYQRDYMGIMKDSA